MLGYLDFLVLRVFQEICPFHLNVEFIDYHPFSVCRVCSDASLKFLMSAVRILEPSY